MDSWYDEPSEEGFHFAASDLVFQDGEGMEILCWHRANSMDKMSGTGVGLRTGREAWRKRRDRLDDGGEKLSV